MRYVYYAYEASKECPMPPTRPFDLYNWLGWTREQVAAGLDDASILACLPRRLAGGRTTGDRAALKSYIRIARGA